MCVYVCHLYSHIRSESAKLISKSDHVPNSGRVAGSGLRVRARETTTEVWSCLTMSCERCFSFFFFWFAVAASKARRMGEGKRCMASVLGIDAAFLQSTGRLHDFLVEAVA